MSSQGRNKGASLEFNLDHNDNFFIIIVSWIQNISSNILWQKQKFWYLI